MYSPLPPLPELRNRIIVNDLSVLDETDVLALLSEALTADVQAVLSDETSLVSADSAVE